MANKRITIRLVGPKEDKGRIRLSAFIDQLGAFLEALKETEKNLSGQDEQFVDYRVIDLSHSSPYTVVVEGIPKDHAPVQPAKVFTTFVSGIRSIQERKPPQSASLTTLRAYRNLSVPARRIDRFEVVPAKNKIIPIDVQFTQKVDYVIGPDTYAYGTISGRLESVNLHTKLRFDIYPTVGPKKVRCIFRKDLLPKVRLALDNYITVSGRMRYSAWDKYPHTIEAKDIDEIHEPNEKLPSLRDLRGIAPHATESMSAEEFVRSIRDANW